MIFETISIIGLSISLTLAFFILFYLKYLERFFKDPGEYHKTYPLVVILLVAFILHNLYLLGSFSTLPLNTGYLEIISVLLFLGLTILGGKRAIILEVSREVRKEGRVRELMEMQTLRGELNNTAVELFETKNFLNSIIQSSADAIVASDLNKKITYFSKGAEELFELSSKDVMGMNVLDLYPSDVLRKKDRKWRARELKQKGSIRNMAMRIVTPSGRSKSISLSLSLLKDVNGRVKGTVGVAKDITKDVESANQIRYLKELSDKIVEGTPQGLILLDLEFKVRRVNSGFEKIAQVDKDSLVGKKAVEFLKIKELSTLFEAMDFKNKFVKVAYDGVTLEPSEFIITQKGKEMTLTDYWTPLFDKKGNVEHVLIILEDITRRKALEESLKEQAKELKKSNDLKDIFTDIMRHDLLNPIGVIKNYIELISDEKVSPNVKQSIDAISRNISKAVEMIENASKLAKIEKLEDIQFEKRDLGTILQETVENVESKADKKGIKLTLKAKDEYPAMVNQFIDAIFLNLLTNALKYSPENSKVTVGVDDLDSSWRVFVMDQGEGIEDRFKKTIFTRFQRLKREGVKGTGLGLAIAMKITQLHKGRIWVEDNPEGGSIFYVEIPKEIK